MKIRRASALLRIYLFFLLRAEPASSQVIVLEILLAMVAR
jgi:hypothetical protein